MATDFKSIPVIDVSSLLAKCDDPNMGEDPHVSQVVKQLDQACRGVGFFYVEGHGIPESLMKEVKTISHEFFNLPYEEKIKIKMTPEDGYRGYQRMKESLTLEGIPELHEAVDWFKEIKEGMYRALGKPMEGCNKWPLQPRNFKALMEEYISLCTELSKNILRGIALALGGSPHEFEGDRAGDAFWACRIIGYPGVVLPDPMSNKSPENEIGCGAHTDYGLLTLINQDDHVTALQVRNLSGEWIAAPPRAGSFVCNIGDMLKIFSNGLYEATLHRVINNSPKYRVSAIYFYETNYDKPVEPLDFCVQTTGGTRKFGRAVYGEHLVNKLSTNFVM